MSRTESWSLLRKACAMKLSRRTLLAGAAGALAAGHHAAAQAPIDPTKVRGKPPRAVGERAPSAAAARARVRVRGAWV